MSCSVKISFNSTLVQLKARMEAAGFNPYNSFNSTLVQLKGIICFTAYSHALLFQFYLSSIKSFHFLPPFERFIFVSILP